MNLNSLCNVMRCDRLRYDTIRSNFLSITYQSNIDNICFQQQRKKNIFMFQNQSIVNSEKKEEKINRQLAIANQHSTE
ncbi:hypothetical protein DERF_013157 [Dermatophagoides farinae]|uniref:Uncharacterized protein n=1 Tax=Dermatophagoides farinae TaxID=6954 RepID=A0A922HQY2_DERFA|nr:hypothetical protein DERF_013157 [Dermatophagoides farinae]